MEPIDNIDSGPTTTPNPAPHKKQRRKNRRKRRYRTRVENGPNPFSAKKQLTYDLREREKQPAAKKRREEKKEEEKKRREEEKEEEEMEVDPPWRAAPFRFSAGSSRVPPLTPAQFLRRLKSHKGGSDMTLSSKRVRTSKTSFAPSNFTNRVKTTSGGKVYITGREWLADIKGVEKYKWCGGVEDAWKALLPNKDVASLLLSPESEVIPWLAQLAKNFQTYRFKYINFIYEPSCSTTETGSVLLAFNPEIFTVDPGDWKAAIGWPVTVHGAPWAPLKLRVPDRPLRKRGEFHMRNNTDLNKKPTVGYNGAVYDPWEYFCGAFGFAVDGSAGVNLLGKLYIEYGVNFYKVKEAGGSVSMKTTTTKMVSTAGFEKAGHQTMSGTTLNAATVGALGYIFGDTWLPGAITAGEAKRAGENLLAMDDTTGVFTSVCDQDLLLVFQCSGTGVGDKVVASEVYVDGNPSAGHADQAYVVAEHGKNVADSTYTVTYAIHIKSGETLEFKINTANFATFSWNIELAPGIFGVHN